MIWLIYAHAAIGLVVTLTIIGATVTETVRAIRQAGRVAAISVRGFGERRRPTLREYLFALRREFLSDYSSLRIGMFKVPHNPSAPIRRWYR